MNKKIKEEKVVKLIPETFYRIKRKKGHYTYETILIIEGDKVISRKEEEEDVYIIIAEKVKTQMEFDAKEWQ